MTGESVDWSFLVRQEKTLPYLYVPNIKNEKGRINSGPTIATGFDLSEHDEKYIESLQVPRALKEKIKPFLGGKSMKGESAKMLLNGVTVDEVGRSAVNIIGSLNSRQTSNRSGLTMIGSEPVAVKNRQGNVLHWRAQDGHGLTLDSLELKLLDDAVRKHELEKISRNYDLDALAQGKPTFVTLSSDVQTAIVSFCWQFGYIWTKPKTDRRRQYWDAVVARDWGKAIELLLTKFDDLPGNRRFQEINLIWRGRLEGMTLGPRGKAMFEKLLLGTRTASAGSTSSGGNAGSDSGGSSQASVALGLT